MIKVKNIVKSYEDLRVLNNISFNINEGSIVTFLGSSGSGKSTLLRCITGIDLEYEGEIIINNNKQNIFLKTHRIALVTQKYGNYPWLSVEENIKLGLKHNLSGNNNNLSLSSLIQSLELDKFEKYYPSQLSGGMQQRVAIGRALAQNSQILAMDEPFGALDYITRSNLQQFLKKLNKTLNKTILFVTHDVEEAIYLSDEIIVLSKLPSSIKKIISIPENLKKHTNKDVRYNSDFISLRSTIEEVLSS